MNPFCTGVNPAARTRLGQSGDVDGGSGKTLVISGGSGTLNTESIGKKISMKIMTLNNSRQKINDCLGNPVEIGIAVTWRVVDTAKAVFQVDNYKEYLSLQCDSALRDIVRIYPYDVAPNVDTTGDGVADEGSLRGSSEIVASRIRNEIQKKVAEAGLEVLEARITYLAYAPEIAAVMLQRQQASAIIDARKMIVDGAVGMVEMALERLSEKNTVELDEERKAAMVSNLLVVLCGNHDAQPVVNSGSVYYVWQTGRRNRFPCVFPPSCTGKLPPGRKMISARSTDRLNIFSQSACARGRRMGNMYPKSWISRWI